MEPREASGDWEAIESRISVVTLSMPLRILVPSLLLSTIRLKTRGASFERGPLGMVIGATLVIGTVTAGILLYPFGGPMPLLVVFWLAGSTGVVMLLNSFRPMAFVKPICTRCRLLPVIREHEAIHISGVESDDLVWKSMRTRYSCESLGLKDDPRICDFCPIPRRLEGKVRA
jgi:hypothetical protein